MTRDQLRLSINVVCGAAIVVLAFWENVGRLSVLMGVSGTFLFAAGVMGWMLEESHQRFWRMHELFHETLARSMVRSEMLEQARAELRKARLGSL